MEDLNECVRNKKSIVLFFSMPFRSRSKRNPFFHGHIALSVDGTVYHAYNPKMLQSSFLVTKMPMMSWLFEDGKFLDDDPNSPSFRQVHLYSKAEAKRTIVYYACIKDANDAMIARFHSYFADVESCFQRGELEFKFLSSNCSSLVAELFAKEKWISRKSADAIPVLFFRRMIRVWKRKGVEVNCGYIDDENLRQIAGFKVHQVVVGLTTLRPQHTMNHFVCS